MDVSDCIFFFNDTATTEIYTLSLHDALPISRHQDERRGRSRDQLAAAQVEHRIGDLTRDRKSTRLNSSHSQISYAVFCLKKKITTCVVCAPSRRIPCLRTSANYSSCAAVSDS